MKATNIVNRKLLTFRGLVTLVMDLSPVLMSPSVSFVLYFTPITFFYHFRQYLKNPIYYVYYGLSLVIYAIFST